MRRCSGHQITPGRKGGCAAFCGGQENNITEIHPIGIQHIRFQRTFISRRRQPAGPQHRCTDALRQGYDLYFLNRFFQDDRAFGDHLPLGISYLRKLPDGSNILFRGSQGRNKLKIPELLFPKITPPSIFHAPLALL